MKSMLTREKGIAICVGSIATVIVEAISIFLFAQLVLSQPTRGLVFPDETVTDASYVGIFAYFAIAALFLFALPPLISTLWYARKNKLDNKGSYLIGALSTFLASIIMLVLMHIISREGWGEVIESGGSYLCLVALLLWSAFSGLVGPIVLFVKRKIKK